MHPSHRASDPSLHPEVECPRARTDWRLVIATIAAVVGGSLAIGEAFELRDREAAHRYTLTLERALDSLHCTSGTTVHYESTSLWCQR